MSNLNSNLNLLWNTYIFKGEYFNNSWLFILSLSMIIRIIKKNVYTISNICLSY